MDLNFSDSLFAIPNKDKTFATICDNLGCENNTPAWPDRFGEAISRWLTENNIPPIRTLSLFSGAGGLDIGFSDAGFEIVSSVEIEEKFCETLRLNTGKGKRFEHSHINCVDIREFSGDGLGNIDFIIGGPPCQTFSAAGRRSNGVLGITDERGVLFREYVRLLNDLSPKGFLFENVYGIVGAQNGEAWQEILQGFSDAGYKLYYRILDAADYGVPQHRERLIIVGLQDGNFKFPRPTHGPDSIDNEPFFNAETAIEGVVSEETDEMNKLSGRYASLLNDIPPGLNYSFYTEEMGHPHPIFAWRSKFSDFLYKADPNEPVRTIKASGGAYTGPLHWDNRFFKMEEYKRLQTIPDNYLISGNKQTAVKQIGNSVPPQLARLMAIAIRQQVFNTQFPFQLSLLEKGEELSFRKRKRELTHVYRMKAKKAIDATQNMSVSLPSSRNYFCTLTPDFRFKESIDKKKSDYEIKVNWGENLTIEVRDINNLIISPLILIKIAPQNRKWALQVDCVYLKIYTNSIMGFTVAWKAFEQELVINSIKADLVQLNGYYQYTPKLLIYVEKISSFNYADVLKSVLSDKDIPKFKTDEQLAVEWNLPINEIMDAADFLRMLGYEIRNHHTNPQIEEGNWLIPYKFPTLSPLSVQLWKKLK